MRVSFSRLPIRLGTLCLAGLLWPVTLATAQDAVTGQVPLQPGSEPAADNTQQTLLPVLRIERQAGSRDVQGLYGDESLNLNLGLEYRPMDGLSLRADAWRLESGDNPAQAASEGLQNGLPQFYNQVHDSNGEFALEQPFFAPVVESEGIDLGASYSWDTDKVGQFTLSTRATYIHDFNQRTGIPALLPGSESELPGNADLQGSLMLTWQFGNHSATAVTNYFDSIKDISELNIDEINQLVEDITTLDLQYGYNMRAGRQDRAVISFSFGIRNIFDKKTTQILNQNSRVVDQNGRVAYGSIKYQF